MTTPHERRWELLAAATLIGLVAATYGAVAGFGFVSYDDPGYVLQNEVVQQGLSWSGAHWAFTHTHMANWHPLTWLSHMLDVQLFGGGAGDAGAHHLTSVVIHGLGTLLLYLALSRLTGRRGCAFVIAALFAVHPLRAESVAWISERKDVLSGLFFMATLIAWEGYGRCRSVRCYAWVLAALILGLLAKPMLVTLPCVLLLLDAWPLGRWRGGILPTAGEGSHAIKTSALLLEKLPLFTVVVAVALATLFAQDEGGALQDLAAVPMAERWAAAPVAIWRYAGKLLWPGELVFHYPPAGEGTSLSSALPAALALVTVTLAVLVGPGRRRPYLALGWLWFVGMLVPVLGLVQVGSQSLADRYTYLPSIGLTLALVFAAADVIRERALPRWLAPALAVVLIAATAVAGRAQVAVWRSSFRLYTHAVSVQGGSPLAHLCLAQVLEKRGELRDAEEHFLVALEGEPDYARNHSAYAELLVELRRPDEAAEHYRRALDLTPDDFATLYGLAELRVLQERWQPAVSLAEQACAQRPGSVEARFLLGTACLGGADFGAAIAAFQQVLKDRPGDESARAQLSLARQRRRESR